MSSSAPTLEPIHHRVSTDVLVEDSEEAIPLGIHLRKNDPLHSTIRYRGRLISQVTQALSKLKDDNKTDPNQIKADKIHDLLDQLATTNRQINLEKDKTISKSKKSKLWCGILSTISVVIVGVNAAAWIVILGGSIYILRATPATAASDPNQSSTDSQSSGSLSAYGLAVLNVVTAAIGTLFTGVLGKFLELVDGEKDRLELIAEISSVKENGVNQFNDFMKSFNEFKEAQKKDSDEQKQQLRECVSQLDKFEKTDCEFRDQLPTRGEWVSLMIRMLPEDHPVKPHFAQLYNAAKHQASSLQIKTPAPDGTEKGLLFPKSLALASPRSFDSLESAAVAEKATASLISASDSSEDNEAAFRSFEGEQASFSSTKQGHVRQKSKHTESAHVRHNTEPDKTRRLYKKIEQECGFSLGSIEVNGVHFNANGDVISIQEFDDQKKYDTAQVDADESSVVV